MYFIGYIIIGLLAGYIASKLMRGSGYGLLINLFLGIIGGVLGGWLFGLLGIVTFGTIGSFVTSVVGAVFFLWIVSLFSPRK